MAKISKIDFPKLILSLVICQLPGIFGSLTTMQAIPVWYASLQKPALAPPNWLFGPVWLTLYLLMGLSLYLVWRKGLKSKDAKLGISFFSIQLFLNAIWSPIFFGAKAILPALVVIIVLWLFILATIIQFYKISKPASYLLIPYLAWVSFASYLNYLLWVLNP